LCFDIGVTFQHLYKKTTPALIIVAGVEKQTHNGGCGEGQIAKPRALREWPSEDRWDESTFNFHAKKRQRECPTQAK